MPRQSTRRSNRGGRSQSAARGGRSSSRKTGQSRARAVRPSRSKRSAGRTTAQGRGARIRSRAATGRRKAGQGRQSSARRTGKTQGSATTTTDHETIQNWAEERDGWPAVVGTSRGDGGVLRIDFPGFKGQGTLKPISWDEWFRIFDERGLAFLYQDRTSDGKTSRFFKLVER